MSKWLSPRWRHAVQFSVGWLLTSGLYLLFAGQFTSEELTATAIFGCIAAIWSALVWRSGSIRLRFDSQAFGAVARAAFSLPPATVKVAGKLLKALVVKVEGHSSEEVFAHGSRSGPYAAGRRAVIVLCLSFGPDRYVVRAPENDNELHLHDIISARVKGADRWPV